MLGTMLALLSDRARFRRSIGGLSLIAAPLALFAGTLVHPGLSENAPALLRIVARHPDAWYATHILGWAFVVLAIPAVLTLAHLLGDRQVALGNLGATLALVGIIGFAGIVTAYGFVAWQMAAAGNQAQMAALFARLNHSPGVWLPLKGMTAALIPGFGCLAVGLLRARAVALWMPPTFFAGVVLFGLGMAKAHTEIILIGTALMTIGLGSIGVLVLRRPLDAWRRPVALATAPAATLRA
jgi:hypothetical protein